MIDVGHDRPRRVVRLLVLILAFSGFARLAAGQSLFPAAAWGVFAPTQEGPAASEQAKETGLAEDNVFPRPDRGLLRQLTHARELTEQARYGEAVRCLDVILNSPEDYLFQPDELQPSHRSLRLEANRVLGRMPRAGLDAYELQYGSQARRLLDRAVESRDVDLLADVSRRFFHTVAGYEATFLLGLHYLDCREPLSAALKLEQVRDEALSADRFEPVLSLSLATCWHRAGFPEQAEDVLRRISARGPEATLSIGGSATRWPVDLKRLRELLSAAESEVGDERARTEWTVTRGNASRNAVVSGSRPLLDPVWKVSLSDHPVAESLLASQSEYHALRNMPIISAFQPLALDNVVVMRSLHTLMAIDPATGKRLWEAPAEDVLEEASEAYRAMFQQPGYFVGHVCQRAWKDHVYGSLSSDGHRVFAVEDLSLGVSGYGRRAAVRGGRRIVNPLWPRSFNRLAAYDARGGKLAWHLGGSSDEFDLELAGVFFLGAPLPVGRQLYQLADVSGEIRLFALEPETGRVKWSQRIAMTDHDITQSSVRRWTSLSPSCGNGVVVCPTASGAIVAVEPGTPSLLWGYRYVRSRSAAQSRPVFTPFPTNQDGSPEWIDGHLVLSKDRVLATPPDSDEIHCLNLLDGTVVWKRPRGGDLYLAAVQGDNVVLVGAREVRALSLETGQPSWAGRRLALPEGSVPSGQGVHVGTNYLLPLSTAEVLVFDLETGREIQRSASSSGTVPGNLICYRGEVISQSVHGLTKFHQIEELEKQVSVRLTENADDAEAWRLKGRILLDEGRPDEAVECLRQSYRLSRQSLCRGQLREALLDGLRRDFARYRSAGDEIRELLDTRAHEVAFLCLMAEGLEAESEWEPALEHYLRLADSCGEGREMIDIDAAHQVRQDRWIRARLASLLERGPKEIVARLDAEVQRRLDVALGQDGTEPLARFVDCFGDLPAAEEGRRELINRYLASKELLAADMAVRRGEKSAEPAAMAATTHELARLLERSGREGDAVAYYRELEDRWGDVASGDGRTGRQIVASLPEKSASLVRPDRAWPVGAVETTTRESEPRAQGYRNHLPLEFQGDRGPFFRQGWGTINQIEKELWWFDGYGREQWKLRVGEQEQQYISMRQGLGGLGASGPLLLLSLGYRCIAIDTLAEGGPQVLWDRALVSSSGSVPSDEAPAVQLFNAQLGFQAMLGNARYSSQGSRVHLADGFTEDYLLCQQFRECMALDPLTGETLWVRRDLPTDGTVFGDRHRVSFVGGDRAGVTVVDARDGRLLAEKKSVPSPGEWVAAVEGKILRWRADPAGRQIELFDPWSQSVIWSKGPFDSNAKWHVLDRECIGVMEPKGRFVLISLRDGQTRVEAQLEPEPTLSEIVLFQLGGSHILVTNGQVHSAGQPNAVFGRQILGASSKTIQKGRVYGFGRSGERLWPDKPQGVSVANQQLLLEQPGWLPILTFAGQRYDQNNREMRWITSVVMIDLRNGRKLIDGEYQAKVPQFRLEGDPEQRAVECAMFGESIRLTFTDRPLAVEEPSAEPLERPGDDAEGRRDKEDGGPKILDAVLDAMRKAVGG